MYNSIVTDATYIDSSLKSQRYFDDFNRHDSCSSSSLTRRSYCVQQ